MNEITAALQAEIERLTAAANAAAAQLEKSDALPLERLRQLRYANQQVDALKASNGELSVSADEAQKARLAAVATLALVHNDLEAIATGMTGDYTAANVANIALTKIKTNAGADLLARLEAAEAERDAARDSLSAFSQIYDAWLDREDIHTHFWAWLAVYIRERRHSVRTWFEAAYNALK